MTINELHNLLKENAKNKTKEFKRLFHGRGGLYEEWKFLTVDSIDTLLFVQFFFEISDKLQNDLIKMLKDFAFQNGYEKLLLKKRHLKNKETTVIFGNIEDEYAIENDMKFTLNLLKNQNIGYFGDMKNARSYIESIAKDKKVLNLFSYTCGFSLFAKRGGAKNIINVDMSKSSLSIGMKNHSLNNLETKGISFLPYNILKSFNALKKKGPFDIIIIDPPTFQKGSFDASKDYKKIISKLSLLSSADATILACLNSPDLDDRFLITLFNENAPVFEFEKKIPNPIEYQSLNEQKSLKTLVFKRKN